MPTCLLMIDNEREAQVLNLGLHQNGVEVVVSKADYKNYTVSLQYQPDFLIMELPQVHTEQMYIATLLKKHPRFRALPIIGYGDLPAQTIKAEITKVGIAAYLERPLKFSVLIENIDLLLKKNRKAIAVPAPKSEEKKKLDYDKLLKLETPPEEKIDTMTQYVSRLMAFPFTVAKVLSITNDEKSGAGHLSQVISADPTISANILKVSNSVFFICSTRRISSIREAIVRIGFLETKKIVMGMAVPKMISDTMQGLGFNRLDFWQHSLAAALFAEKLAKFMGDVNPEIAFLAGLLHDLGVIILDEFFIDLFAVSLKETSTQGGHFPDRQNELFGFNHMDLIAKLFPNWKMSGDITNAIVNQFRYAAYKDNVDTLEKKLTLCVMLGNILAKTVHFGRECDQFVWPIENWVFEQTHVGSVISEKFVDEIRQNIAKYSVFLSLESRDYGPDLKTKRDAADLRIGIVNTADHLFIPPELYLQSKGFQVERILAAGPVDESARKRYSLVIVWSAATEISRESLAAYAGFEKYRRGDETPADRGERAPLLLAVPSDFKDAQALPPEVSYIGNRFDLRELDNTLEKIFSGSVVRVLPSEKKPVPDAAPQEKAPVAAAQ